MKNRRKADSVVWQRSFAAYQSHELRAIRFKTVAAINAAIDKIWESPDLKGMPSDSPDGWTLFVPTEAVPLLQSEGLKFTISRLAELSDLSPGEIAAIRGARPKRETAK